jgi:nucleotide-binding universal stress UspA family protein
MIKTILAPVGGGSSDQAVLHSVLTLATPLLAHIEFLHVHVSPADAALNSPRVDFASGAALRNALRELDDLAARRAAQAELNVLDFCMRFKIELLDKPRATTAVTANWRREEGNALQRLLFHARHNDLAVMSRPTESDGLETDRLESLLLRSGRPMIIVPAGRPITKLGTAMVCWKEAPDAARALSTAMPILEHVERIIIVSVREGESPEPKALEDLVDKLGWHGKAFESVILARDGKPTSHVLLAAGANLGADLLVMGGYGHSHTRQMLFGGCTQAAIESADIPVFLMH